MKTTPLPSVEEVQPQYQAKFETTDYLMQDTKFIVEAIVTQRDDQSYTSLVEGIEGMMNEEYCGRCDNELEFCDCSRYETIEHILENVVKPLYGKK